MPKILYIVLMVLGAFLSGLAAPAPQEPSAPSASGQHSAFRLRQKVKSELELGYQQAGHVRTLTAQRHLPGGFPVESVPLRPTFVPSGSPAARQSIPADKLYLDHIYPTHHFW